MGINQSIALDGNFNPKTEIVDSSNNAAAVKPASTAAAATDPALVVAVSPNNIVTVQGASGVAGTPSGGIITVQGPDSGALINAIIDAANSTTTPLAANATFTGAFTNCSGFSTLSLLLFTDQVSATNGLVVQYSTDGTNVDDNDQYSVAASNGQQISFPLVGKFYRIVYTNGATLQGVFRMQAKLHVAAPKSSSVRSSDSVNDQQDTELVKSIIMGQVSSTVISNIAATAGTELRVAQISNGSGVQGALTVGTTAVLVSVSGTNQAGRISATLYNNSVVQMFWGYTNAVTTSSGTPIQPGQSVQWDVGPATSVFVIAGTAGNNARVTEAIG
jgi:hypothetical protein